MQEQLDDDEAWDGAKITKVGGIEQRVDGNVRTPHRRRVGRRAEVSRAGHRSVRSGPASRRARQSQSVSETARRSARCLMPSSIFRSITSEPISIGSIPIRDASVGSRNRLRLMSLVRPARSSSTKVHTQLPSAERQARTRSCSRRSTACGSCRNRSCRPPWDAGTRGARGRRCACGGRAGSRSSRRCRRRHAAPVPSAPAMATLRPRAPRPTRRGSRHRWSPAATRHPAIEPPLQPASLPRSGSAAAALRRRARRGRQGPGGSPSRP